ncbi:hypothetical protein Q4543_04125 [Salipiger sp. 1_MG-2023]|nr:MULTISPECIES: hypothetical protein [Roseobacteraceae]MDO6584698.1 hypothetical protein [Salipiger sp. 1_MG-2023]
MKAMLSGFVAIVIIGVGAYFTLESLGFSSQEVYSSPNVRVD